MSSPVLTNTSTGNPTNTGIASNAETQSALYCVTSFAAIDQMRKNRQLCDIKLEIGDETLHAHRLILASASSYFNAMFNNDMLESTQGAVRLHDIDVDIVKYLIDYIYTGEMNITEDNVQVLLSASRMLCINLVQEACCEFLMHHLHPSNCLAIRSFADTHSCKELHNKAHKYILQNFQQIYETEEFLLLSYEEVRDLISSNYLNICSEETVFHSVMNWIKHDLDKRQIYIAELMSHVRLPLVNRDFLLTSVDTEPLIQDNLQCNKQLLDAMKYHLAPEKRSLMVSEWTQKRRPNGTKPHIIVFDYRHGLSTECEFYNSRTSAWSSLAPLLVKRQSSSFTSLNNILYAIGGSDGINIWDTAECYNPLTNKWSYIKPMLTKRASMGICAFNDMIYVCGGSGDDTDLSSTERYDPLTDVWSSCPSMNTRRKYCSSAVLDNSIYTCGDINSKFNNSSVERLDPREGRWYSVPKTTTRRSCCAVASCDGFLYCIGGSYRSNLLSSGERFNQRSNTWEPIADMHTKRTFPQVLEIDGSLYVLGGHYKSPDLNCIERYDVRLNTWTIVSSWEERRILLSAAVLDCFDLETTTSI